MLLGSSMRYRLKFLNAQEQLVREFDIEADDDDSAIQFACEQSIGFNMAAEICHENRSVIRVTPMTALLFLPGSGDPRP